MKENSLNSKSRTATYKKIYFFFCTIFSVLALSSSAYAVSAAPDAIQIMQPDGSPLSARVKGDEWNNRVETAHGYSIKKDIDGYWNYISHFDDEEKPVLTRTRAHRTPPAGLKKHVRRKSKNMRGRKRRSRVDSVPASRSGSSENESPAASGPTASSAAGEEESSVPGGPSSSSGEGGSSDPGGPSSSYGELNGKILFILTEFTDRSGTYSEASFASFITNNIADYFDKASNGNVTLTPANESYGTADNGVVGWVNVGYAHPNSAGSTNDANRQMSKDAIIAADPYIDFSAYDGNGDGYVDSDELAVVVIAAGYETSYDGGSYTPTVWGHQWTLGWGSVDSPLVDGVRVGDYHAGTGGYAQFGEVHQSNVSNSHQATMGIMVHELGHLIFGLPDLYDIDGSSEGVGAFCIMGAGSWGKANTDTYSGETPVLPGAWTKYNRGWVNPSIGSGSTSIVATGSISVTETNSVYKLPTELPNEYFLVENRQPAGYDRGLERWLGSGFGGLAIWHLDEVKVDNTEECIPPADCSSTHFKVAVVQADGSWHFENDINRGNGTDLWYLGNAASFNSLSTPDSDLYDDTLSSVSVTDISASGDTMSAQLSAPSIYTVFEEDFESGSLGVSWSTNSTLEGRMQVTESFMPHGGDYHLTMDDSVNGGSTSLNELILTVDLAGETGVLMGFFHKEIGDEDHIMPSSFSGSHNSDGVAISADGTTWYKVQGLVDGDGIDSDYRMFVVDLDAAIASAGITYNSTFRIKFQQYDNYAISSDGFAFDDILITADDSTPPVSGGVTPSSTQYLTYVDSPFNLSTNFTDNETDISACEYCVSTDGTCDTEWTSATLSGSSPSWTCSVSGLTGSDGQSLTLNMRATSGGGTGEGSAVTRTVDTAPPVTTDNSTSTWTAASPVSITLTPADGSGAGVSSTQYCVDTANSCTPGSSGTSVNVTCASGSECLQYVRYGSTDNVGNQETTKAGNQIQQDRKNPFDGTSSATPDDSQVDLSWSGFSDSGSGLDGSDTYKVVYSTAGYPSVYCTDGTDITDVTTQTSYSHSGLSNGTAYYYRVCAYDDVGNISSGSIASETPEAEQFELTTSVNPGGGGSINPDCSGGCMYDNGTLVVLTASDNGGYEFSSWTNCDSPSGNSCTMTMDANKGLTANFQSCPLPVRIVDAPPVYYSTLQSAYDNALDGDTIQSHGVTFVSDLNVNRSISVTIEGGYDCNYSAVTGTTTLNGDMPISDGSVDAENFVIGN
jgi:M6 family metalloprotease-like protein